MPLTKSERQIMELLWGGEGALTATEIIHLVPNRCWKSSYVHLLINSLLKKDMVEVDGMKRTSKNYARTFKAKCTKSVFLMKEMNLQKELSPKTLPYLVSTLISQTEDTELIDELEQMIQKRKDELK